MSLNYSSISEKKKALESSRMSTKPAKKTQATFKFITLSEALVQFPHNFDETKIQLVQKFVSEIDELPKRFRNIETLYLSNNNIRFLDGLQQFSRLKNVSLAHNEIDDPITLQALKECPSIESLNLSGNQVCRSPSYRDLVITALPNLKTLDGKNVTNEEKFKSEVNLKTHAGLLDVMLSNYCELIKMNNFQKKLEIHKELLSKNQKFSKNYIPVNVGLWKTIYQYENYLDEDFKAKLKKNLLKDITTLKNELNLRDDEDEVAFSELILKQQQRVSELFVKAEEFARSMNKTFYSAELKRHESTEKKRITSPKSVASPQRSFEAQESLLKYKPKDLKISKSPDRFSTTESTKRKRIPDEQDLFQKLSHTENTERLEYSMMSPQSMSGIVSPTGNKNKTFSQNPDTYRSGFGSPGSSGKKFRDRTPEPITLDPPKPSHKEECCRNIHKKINSMDYEEKTARHKSPFRKKLEEKENIIENMKNELKMKSESLLRIEEYNRQLRDKLKEYQQQNEENIKLAQIEITRITQELQENQERQATLESEIKNLKMKLNEMFVRNHELEKANEKLREVETRANDYANELQARVQEESGLATAGMYNDRKILENGWRALVEASKTSKKYKSILSYFGDRSRRKTMVESFQGWAKYSLINAIIKRRQQAKVNTMAANCFLAWVDEVELGKTLNEFWKDQQAKSLKKHLSAWKRFINNQESKRMTNKAVIQHHLFKTLKKVFKRFVEIRKRNTYTVAEEKAISRRSEKHYQGSLKARLFRRWQRWAVEDAKPVRISKEKSANFRNNSLVKRGLTAWMSYMIIREKLQSVVEVKHARKNKHLLREYFKAWAVDFGDHLRKMKILEGKKKKFIKRRLLDKWKSELTLKYRVQNGYEVAIKHSKKTLFKKGLKSLIIYRKSRKQLSLYKNIIKTKHTTIQVQKFFTTWLYKTKDVQLEKVEDNRARLESLAFFFKGWNRFYQTRLTKKMNQKSAERHLQRSIKQKIETIFRGLAKYTRWRKRNQDVLCLVRDKKKFSIYKRVFMEFLKNAHAGLRKANSKLNSQVSILHLSMRDNNDVVNNLDAERNEILHKNDYLHEEISNLKDVITDKDHEILGLKRVISQYERNEKKIIDELNGQANITKVLESKINLKEEQAHVIIDDKDNEINSLRNEKVNLMRRIAELEKEALYNRSAHIESEKSILNKSAGQENTLRELEKKLAHSIKIGNDFKLVIEKKDGQIKLLNDQLDKAHAERHDYQKKLADAMITIRETKEFYEAKIRAMEAEQSNIHHEVVRTKDENVRQERQINDLKSELRRYEYQSELNTRKSDSFDGIKTVAARQASPLYKHSLNNHPLSNDFTSTFSPNMELFNKEKVNTTKEMIEKKIELDEKIHILEGLVAERETKEKNNSFQARYLPRAGLGDSLNLTDSGILSQDISTRYEDSYSNSKQASANKLNSILKKTGDPLSISGRGKSPAVTRSPTSGKSIRFEQSPRLERYEGDRRYAKDAIERRIQDLNDNIVKEVSKVKNKFLN